MRKILLAFAILFPVIAFAQIEWTAKEYDFGSFKEVEGPRTAKLTFVNKGKKPTFINHVRTSCGCTAASYTKKIIQPGETGTVSVTYNPTGRPGRFKKSVRVYTGEDNELSTLKIFGTVIGAPASLEAHFPESAGPLRLENKIVMGGEVRRGAARHLYLNAYNQSADTIRPKFTSSNPDLEVELEPKAIPPGDLATFGFYVKAHADSPLGRREDKVSILPDSSSPESEQMDVEVFTVIVDPGTKNKTEN